MTQDHIKKDPKEDDPRYRDIIEQAGIEAKEIINSDPDATKMGRCHAVWDKQKRILKEKHGIDWKTPKEMNKDIRFD